MAINFQALRFKMHDKNFYLGLIGAGVLVENFEIDTWSIANKKGYQRGLKKNRSKKYADYLGRQNSYQHQTILLNIRDESKIIFDQMPGQAVGTLTIKDKFYVVDGQHRTHGIKIFLEANPSSNNLPIPVIVMVGFGQTDEAREFLVVNKTQKGVRADLSDRILADVISDMDKEMLEILGIREAKSTIEQMIKLVDILNKEKDSIWFHRVNMPNEKFKPTYSIKQGSLTDSLKPALKDNFIAANYRINRKLAAAIITYWDAIRDLCPKASGDDFKHYVLLKTTGAFVMHKLFPVVLIKAGDRPTKAKMKSILGKIEEMNDDDWHVDGEIGDYGTNRKSFDRLYNNFKEQL